MINKKNVSNFLDYNFKPFNKFECIKRIVFVWILNIPFYVFGGKTLWLSVAVSIVSALVSVFFIKLVIKHSTSKKSRFLCDGIVYLYYAIICNMFSYKVLTFVVGEKIFLFIFFLLMLVVFVTVYIKLIYKYVKEDRYNTKNANKTISSFPFLYAFGGCFLARLLLRNVTNESAFVILSMCLLLLSFIVSIGCINLVKVLLYNSINEKNNE